MSDRSKDSKVPSIFHYFPIIVVMLNSSSIPSDVKSVKLNQQIPTASGREVFRQEQGLVNVPV